MPCSGRVLTLFTKLFGLLRKPYEFLSNSNFGVTLGNWLVQLMSGLGRAGTELWRVLPRRSNLNLGFVKSHVKTICNGIVQLGPWVRIKFQAMTGAATDLGGAGVPGGGNPLNSGGPGISTGSAGGGDYSAFYSSQSAGLVQRSSAAAGAGAGGGGAVGGAGADLFQPRPWPEQKRAE